MFREGSDLDRQAPNLRQVNCRGFIRGVSGYGMTACGAKRPFDVSQVLTVKSPGYSLCYLLVGYAIYPPTRHLAVKVRLFIDFLVERFSAGPKAGIGRSNAMDA